MRPAGFVIQHSVVIKQNAPGEPGEKMLCAERRSPKVGQLSMPSRLVIEATRRCLEGVERNTDDIIGISIGTLCSANDVVERSLRTVRSAGIAGVSASWYATGLPNSTAGVVASMAGLRGPNLTLLGYQAGIDAIIMACRMLRAGGARRMLAGGFDLPSEPEMARLRKAPALAGKQAMLPGIGLLLLTNRVDYSTDHSACVVGWSYGVSGQTSHDALIESATAPLGRASTSAPIRHLISPGQTDVEYLAAGGPIRLAEALTTLGEDRLHAFIVDGHGLRPTCLVVDINGHVTSNSSGVPH